MSHQLLQEDHCLEEVQHNLKPKQDSLIVGFLAGATSSIIAEVFTLPLCTAKVRMMLYGMKGKYRSISSSLMTIKNEQGFKALWNGFTPSAFRQSVFSGVKLSLYEPIRNALCKDDYEKLQTPLYKKLIAGVVSGAIACVAATPGDVLAIRMQDSEFSKRYSGIGDMMSKIYKTDGLGGYFKGLKVNIWRQMVMNAAELSAYDASRQYVIYHTRLSDNPSFYLFYGMIAGFVGAFAAQPFDLIKTRVMNNPEVYKNPLTCLKMTVAHGGVLSLYNGITPFMARAVGFNSVFFLLYGHFRQYLGKKIDGE